MLLYIFLEREWTIANILATHYDAFIMGAIASQITSLTIVYSTDQSKHQSSALLAFVWGIHRGPVNSPHKWPISRKMFPFDDVIMIMDDIMAVDTADPRFARPSVIYSLCQKFSDDLWIETQMISAQLATRHNSKESGARLKINIPPYQYRDPHVKDKTVSRPSYL